MFEKKVKFKRERVIPRQRRHFRKNAPCEKILETPEAVAVEETADTQKKKLRKNKKSEEEELNETCIQVEAQ